MPVDRKILLLLDTGDAVEQAFVEMYDNAPTGRKQFFIREVIRLGLQGMGVAPVRFQPPALTDDVKVPFVAKVKAAESKPKQKPKPALVKVEKQAEEVIEPAAPQPVDLAGLFGGQGLKAEYSEKG